MDSRQWPGSQQGFLLGPSNCTLNAGRSRPAHSKPVAVCCSRDGTHAPPPRSVKLLHRHVWHDSLRHPPNRGPDRRNTDAPGPICQAMCPDALETICAKFRLDIIQGLQAGLLSASGRSLSAARGRHFFKTQKPFPRVATSRFHSEHLVYSHGWSN